MREETASALFHGAGFSFGGHIAEAAQNSNATINIWPMVKPCFDDNIKTMARKHINDREIGFHFLGKTNIAKFRKAQSGKLWQ